MREFAKVSEVKAGDVLEADGGFTCIAEGAKLKVEAHENGELHVPCACGSHDLDSQNDGDGVYIGLYRVEG